MSIFFFSLFSINSRHRQHAKLTQFSISFHLPLYCRSIKLFNKHWTLGLHGILLNFVVPTFFWSEFFVLYHSLKKKKKKFFFSCGASTLMRSKSKCCWWDMNQTKKIKGQNYIFLFQNKKANKQNWEWYSENQNKSRLETRNKFEKKTNNHKTNDGKVYWLISLNPPSCFDA